MSDKAQNHFTSKESRFCQEYMVDLNATQAAIRAGYSEKNARQIGNEVLGKEHIASRISVLKAKAAQQIEYSHQDVLKRLKSWVESDITETINLSPSQIKELPLEVRQLITKFKHTKRFISEGISEEVVELHFVSKERAIEMINRHIGFYELDNKQRQGEIDPAKLSTKTLQDLLNASG